MKYLVTGAAGFIGSHLCNSLLARKNKVWGIDNFSKGSPERIRELEHYPDFSFIKGSVLNAEKLRPVIKEIDIIYHLAAVVGVKRYVENPAEVVEENVCQTLTILKLAQEYGKKVVFTSTSEVYGKSPEVPFKENGNRVYGPSETDRWCYAISKSAAEHLCVGYIRQGLPIVILRYFNVYGPHADSSDYGGVISRFIEQALSNNPLTVHGDGSQTRCFTHVEDMIRGTIEAGHREEAEEKIFNLGSTRETSILELAQIILEISGSKAGIVFQPYHEFYGPFYEDIPRRIPDLSAAKSILGYHPEITLEDGLRQTLAWYKGKSK